MDLSEGFIRKDRIYEKDLLERTTHCAFAHERGAATRAKEGGVGGLKEE